MTTIDRLHHIIIVGIVLVFIRIKKKGVFQQCVVLLLEMVLRGQVDIKAAAHCQVYDLSRWVIMCV